jgi:ABC-2 type transport system ATP-binding protein
MNSEECVVDMQDVTKRFGKTTAVNAVNLVIPKGITLGLLGQNGAGKSTTLKMLMGMMRPTSGTVRVLGMPMPEMASKVKQRIGYVPESHHIYRWMRVKEAVRFARALYATWNEDLCANLMDAFHLPASRHVRGLSKGMLAKLSLLIALSLEPDLLVLDEPLSGLDPIARDDFIDGVLTGICNGERTVVFSSHHLEEVSRLADSVAIMNAGRILVHRPIDELLSSVRRVRAVLRDGRLPIAPPAGTIWQRVNRREWLLTIHPFTSGLAEELLAANPIENVEVSSLSLDDVFKDFIKGQATLC